MEHGNQARALIQFLNEEIVRDANITLTEDTPLVSSGLVDSLGLVEILLELERVTGRKIPAGRLSPSDFETVRAMLAAAARIGSSPGS